MRKLREYLTLAGLALALALPLLARCDAERKTGAQVADLAEAVLAVRAWQDSTANAAAIREAVRAWVAEHGDRRQPTQAEIVGVLAETVDDERGKTDTSADSRTARVTARLRAYARKQPGIPPGKAGR